MFLQKSKHDDHVSDYVIYSIYGVFQSAYGYKSFNILINFENFPSADPFPFDRSQLNKHVAWRKLKEWETSTIVLYKVLTPKLFFKIDCRNRKKKTKNCKYTVTFEI